MTSAYYEKLYGEPADIQELFFKTREGTEEEEDEIQKDYMDMDGVASVTFTSSTSERIADMLKSMDTVIYVLVISAGGCWRLSCCIISTISTSVSGNGNLPH